MTAGERTGQTPGLGLRLGAFYGALFLLYGVLLPYFPLWLEWQGLTPAEIAVVAAVPMFVRLFFTTAVAFLADRSGDQRTAAIILMWVGLAAALSLARADSFWPILVLSLLWSLANSSVLPLIETLAMAGVKHSGLDYGRVRLWGSLTFIAASLIGGVVISRIGSAAAIWLMAAGAAATVVAAHLLPKQDPRVGAEAAAQRLKLTDALHLAGSRTFLLLLLAAGGVQAAHAMYYAFGTLHWQAQGIAAGTAGVLWAVGVIAEIGLFAVSGRAIQYFGPLGLLMAGAGAAVVRWSVMTLDPPLPALVVLQLLHGLTYGAAHLGAVHFIGRSVPDNQSATAQALYGTVSGGLALGLATLAAGSLYPRYAGATYLIMAALGAVGLTASLALKSRR